MHSEDGHQAALDCGLTEDCTRVGTADERSPHRLHSLHATQYLQLPPGSIRKGGGGSGTAGRCCTSPSVGGAGAASREVSEWPYTIRGGGGGAEGGRPPPPVVRHFNTHAGLPLRSCGGGGGTARLRAGATSAGAGAHEWGGCMDLGRNAGEQVRVAGVSTQIAGERDESGGAGRCDGTGTCTSGERLRPSGGRQDMGRGGGCGAEGRSGAERLRRGCARGCGRGGTRAGGACGGGGTGGTGGGAAGDGCRRCGGGSGCDRLRNAAVRARGCGKGVPGRGGGGGTGRGATAGPCPRVECGEGSGAEGVGSGGEGVRSGGEAVRSGGEGARGPEGVRSAALGGTSGGGGGGKGDQQRRGDCVGQAEGVSGGGRWGDCSAAGSMCPRRTSG